MSYQSLNDVVMREVWLAGNRRILALMFALGALGLLIAATLFCIYLVHGGKWLLISAGVVAVGSAVMFFAGWSQHRAPLVYVPDVLIVRAPGRAEERIPVDVVECFLLGRAPANLSGRALANAETATLVVRLRPLVGTWERRDVDPRWGSWCGHQIIIRGTWCEPLGIELVNRLNARLVACQRHVQKEKSQ